MNRTKGEKAQGGMPRGGEGPGGKAMGGKAKGGRLGGNLRCKIDMFELIYNPIKCVHCKYIN